MNEAPHERGLALCASAVARGKDRSLAIFARYATIIGLGAMILAFSILSPDAFPTLSNFTNVLNQASLAMIIAGGLTLAVVVGELDLSIGYAASLHGVLVTGLSSTTSCRFRSQSSSFSRSAP